VLRAAVSLLSLAVAAPALADDVYLVNGRRLSGRVVERTADRVVIVVGPGRIALPASQIDRIVSGESALQRFEERAARLASSDLEGWLSLGIWARDQGLGTQARMAFERVVAADPANPIANAGLGRVPYEGRWMSEEERYRAQGLVQHGSRWVTVHERELELRERAAEAESRRIQAEADARVREAEARARAAEAEARAAERAYGPGPYSPGITGPVIGGTVVVPLGHRRGRRASGASSPASPFFPEFIPAPRRPVAPAPMPPRPRAAAKRTSIN
jgi:hypothetical protein